MNVTQVKTLLKLKLEQNNVLCAKNQMGIYNTKVIVYYFLYTS